MSPPPVAHRLILAHPDPASFCAAVAHRWDERARRNHQSCAIRDLYQDGFDPVLKATEQPGKPGYVPLAENIAECRELQDSNVLVLVYPVWFGTPPAMLKGYLERVIGSGITFGDGKPVDRPLSNVRLVQISTSASSGPWLSEKGIPSALHTIFDSYIAEVFGAKATHRLHLASITEAMSAQHAATSLAQVDELADQVCAAANAARWDRTRKEIPGA